MPEFWSILTLAGAINSSLPPYSMNLKESVESQYNGSTFITLVLRQSQLICAQNKHLVSRFYILYNYNFNWFWQILMIICMINTQSFHSENIFSIFLCFVLFMFCVKFNNFFKKKILNSYFDKFQNFQMHRIIMIFSCQLNKSILKVQNK